MFGRKAKPATNETSEGSDVHRLRMVERQLRARGISDSRVLAAMADVPRDAFVPERLKGAAYDDNPLPIGSGQTISQPYTVAFMAQALELSPTDLVLEIGTGSGYSAAILGRLAAQVHSVERIDALAQHAQEVLQSLAADNVQVHVGDGSLGWPDAAPYQAIIVTAGAAALPLTYLDQLAEGGRILIPLGRVRHRQTLILFRLRGGELEVIDLGRFAFVPLVGEHGWSEGG